MHSRLTLLLADQRDHELRAAAGRYRPRAPGRRHSVRHRAGWALVTVGLMLVRGSGDA
jgi:hypothetical protein